MSRAWHSRIGSLKRGRSRGPGEAAHVGDLLNDGQRDLPAWRPGVVELLRLTLAAWDGPVIVPMTLVNSGYFQEIVGSMRDDGLAVNHFALLAQPATVRPRPGRRSLGLTIRHIRFD